MTCDHMSTTYTINCGKANDCHAGRCRDLYVSRRDCAVLTVGRAVEYEKPVSQHKSHKVTRMSSCQFCGCGIVQVGSGRHKTNCGSKRCKAAYKRASYIPQRGNAVIRYSRRKHIYKIKMARVKCMDCSLLITHDTMSVFEMDHRDPALKLFEVSYTRSRTRTAEEIDDEALKCDMVCANCHRTRTATNGDIAKGHARFISTVEPVQISQFASLCDCPEWNVA